MYDNLSLMRYCNDEYQRRVETDLCVRRWMLRMGNKIKEKQIPNIIIHAEVKRGRIR